MAIRVHELKIAKDYADSVLFGDKTFEVRLSDRGFQRGDIVRFQPLSKSGASVDTSHPLYDKKYEITYVLGSFYGPAQGYVAFGIKPIPEQTDAEIPKNALDCTGCRFVGTYDTEFPCENCVRKNKDYYTAEQTDCP